MSQFRLVHAQRALTRVRPTTLPTPPQTITTLTRSFATISHTSTPTSHTPSASASASTSASTSTSAAVTRRQQPPAQPAQSSSQANPAFTKTECGLWIDRSLPSNFSKILIANRGEIACRIIRTCRQLGIKTVAVYSDADINAQHVAMADEAYRIGEAPVAKSYLLGPTILEIAKKSGAQAVHPGYGFLSENAHFARQCDAAGIVFIGPPIGAIDAMGSKSASKIIMTKAGVPVVPGYHGDDQSIERLRSEAQKCGYPLMLKAVLGGGGKGMRIVRSHEEFDESLEACKREALASFGDERVLLERYIVRPRHIEFQVFGDHHGNAVHLYERDCSVQRRHQKVLEEAPAPGMSPEMRASMGASACAAARAVGYVGAGTVEFIFDADTNEYFFMEMNTRLQVEHPVTEMIMHRDLVQWQLHVGYGYPLPVKQEQLHAHGYAIEARVYAENPFNNFLPSTGRLHHLRTPALSPTVRVESGVREGDDVSIFYDPMIAKLVCWGATRDAALANMTSCLEQYQIVGPPNNIPFLLRAVNHPRFRQGMVDTSFIAQNLRDLVPRDTATSSHITSHAVKLPYQHVASLALLSLIQNEKTIVTDVWKQTNGFRVNAPATRRVTFSRSGYNDEGEVQLEKLEVDITPQADGRYTFKFADGSSTSVLPVRSPPTPSTHANIYASIDGTLYASAVVRVDADVHVFVHGTQTKFVLPVQSFTQSGAGGSGSVAPMSGKIVKVQTQPKQHVKKGTALVIMEAMKMEHVIRAPKDGIVAAILYKPGEFVEGGKLVVTFEQEKEE